jgi:hypothetical protein
MIRSYPGRAIAMRLAIALAAMSASAQAEQRVAPPAQPGPAAAASSWTAGAADLAAWRLRATTRLGGALSQTGVSFDRTMVAVTADRDGSLHVVDALTLKPSARIALPGFERYSLGGIAILDDSKRVAVVRSGALEVYDIASRAQVQRLAAQSGYDTGHLSLSRDGQRLYFIRSSTSSQRSTIGVYRIASDGLKPETEYPFAARVDSFDSTADDGRFLLGTYPTDQLILYDARNKQVIWTQKCQCSARFGAQERLVVFAGRPDASAGNFGANTIIGVLDIANPERRATFDTRGTASLNVNDVSPDQRFAAVGSTNNGQVTIVPVSLDAPRLAPLIVLKDNSRQSIAGAKFVGPDALVTMSGDNNARLWKK